MSHGALERIQTKQDLLLLILFRLDSFKGLPKRLILWLVAGLNGNASVSKVTLNRNQWCGNGPLIVISCTTLHSCKTTNNLLERNLNHLES